MINLSSQEKQFHRSNYRRWLLLIPVMILLLLVLRILSGGQGNEQAKAGKGPIPVTVLQASLSTIPIVLNAIGAVEPVSTVNLKPQVDGAVEGIHFKEGQYVHAGDLLFTIDPRPLIATLSQSRATVSRDMSQVQQAVSNLDKDKSQVKLMEANLQKDLAELSFAQGQEKRYANLLKQEYVSREQYEQIQTSRNTAEATVSADRAAVENTKAVLNSDLASIESSKATVQGDQAAYENSRLKLHYGYVRSPVSGRTGNLLVHEGDVVNANATSMVVINQIDPINVTFAIPEQQLADIQKYQQAGTLKVAINLPAHPDTSVVGHLSFLDNAVDAATGTLRLKGTFNNSAKLLWPGQFVNVVLTLANEPNSLALPVQAIQTGQHGDYVFIDNAGVAQYRAVLISRRSNGLAIIQHGVKPGEKVIVDGQLQLAPGLKVKEIHGT